ncbi:MAG: hypothetical protein KJZ92_17520 [Rhodocyclaceae bacterium]|nr:hypothetical protein [Rhodocyclaceae bacterium]
MQNLLPIIEVTTNHWRVPSENTAMDGWIEGRPTEEMKRKAIEDARTRRAQWKPSPEGWQLVEQLAYLIGSRIRIQFWSPVMFMLEEEGPFPVEADLVNVLIKIEDGFPQAYMCLKSVTEIPTPDGCTASGYMTADDKSKGHLLASLAGLYTVTKII